MFHRVSDGSKVAVVDLCHRLVQAGVVVIDTEQESEHMEHLGQIPVSRQQYVGLVRRLRDQHVELPTERRPVDQLVQSSER